MSRDGQTGRPRRLSTGPGTGDDPGETRFGPRTGLFRHVPPTCTVPWTGPDPGAAPVAGGPSQDPALGERVLFPRNTPTYPQIGPRTQLSPDAPARPRDRDRTDHLYWTRPVRRHRT